MKEKICIIFNSISFALLVCSLAFNYAIWTGHLVKSEWVADYVNALAPGQKK